MKSDKILSNELFYCEHLTDDRSIVKEIKKNFFVLHERGKGLEIYLKERSFIDERFNENRTYIVRDIITDEIVGYFSLKAGLFSIQESIDLTIGESVANFETLPGIELAEFAINQRYIVAHPEKKGSGIIVFNDFVIPIVKKVQKWIGVKVLYIFALPEKRLIDVYMSEYGFKRLEKCDEDNLHNRLKPRFDYGCIFMYQVL